MQILGIDLGFGFTKATDGQRSLVIKSLIGEATDGHFAAPPPAIAAGRDHIHLEFEDRGVFVGDMAERQSALRSFTLDQERFLTDAARVLTLGAVTALGAPDEPIRVVTGLPISRFADRADELTRLLIGRHSFVAIDPDGSRRRTVVEITDVRVIPQPFGSMYDALLNDAGDYSDRNLLQEKVGVVDVGFQTSDFTVSDRGVFLERASQSTDNGIGRAFAQIAAKVREKSGVSVEVYRLYEAMAEGRIKVRGNTFDLSKLIEHVLTQLATDLASEVTRLWADEWDMDSILITGGGGSVLAPYLTPLLSGRVLPVDASRDARLNNVRGFWKLGVQTWAAAPAPAPIPVAEQPGAESPREVALPY